MTLPLLQSAQRLLGAAKRKPSQADLRRTVSTAYYAAFDALARLCGDELVGSSPAKRGLPEWRRVYRALDHGRGPRMLEELRVEFPGAVDPAITRFCATLKKLHQRRLEADYDPSPLGLKRADVALLIDEVQLAVDDLANARPDQRRRFAYLCVLVKRG